MIHVPVLLSETLELLSPAPGESYLDLTAGYGGHASAVLKATKADSKIILVDRDQYAIDHLTSQVALKNARIIKDNFLNAVQILGQEGQLFDLVLADLGVSSPHLDIANRGFSFLNDGPLDMRMDQSDQLTAAEIVNSESEAYLARILLEYGEEGQYRRIAKSIVEHRPYKTTHELAKIIESSIGWRVKGHHPATQTFQALRIAVNGELDLLERMIPRALKLLAPGGRFAIITFHSLEDRVVKRAFADVCSNGYDAEYQLLVRKPVTATHSEIVNNPRARSAKLRALVKIKTKGP
ncbi:MAG: 16S rRNA (cytosine(1402)-N(4))-methyltransferase RsmH [Patescibacteria group bacterium]